MAARVVMRHQVMSCSVHQPHATKRGYRQVDVSLKVRIKDKSDTSAGQVGARMRWAIVQAAMTVSSCTFCQVCESRQRSHREHLAQRLMSPDIAGLCHCILCLFRRWLDLCCRGLWRLLRRGIICLCRVCTAPNSRYMLRSAEHHTWLYTLQGRSRSHVQTSAQGRRRKAWRPRQATACAAVRCIKYSCYSP